MIKTAVVILNWNGLSFLKKFLPGVLQYADSDGYQVFVADNGSTDGSVQYLQTLLDERNIIKMDKNYGFALGYRKALESIKAEHFVLLNSDVEVTPGWVKPVISFMGLNPDVAACMPKIKSYANRDMFEYAGASGGYLDKHGYPYCRGRVLSVIERDRGQYNDIAQVFWATGACLFIKSAAYFEVDGLDGDFFAHMEEIDLCWRLNNKGYKVMVYPGVEVFHVGGGTLPNENPRKLYFNFRNSLYLLHKNLPEEKFRTIMLQRFILDFVAAAHYLLLFKLSFAMAVFKAYLSYFRNLKHLKLKRKQTLALTKSDKSTPSTGLSVFSVLYQFYFLGNKTFRAMVPERQA